LVRHALLLDLGDLGQLVQHTVEETQQKVHEVARHCRETEAAVVEGTHQIGLEEGYFRVDGLGGAGVLAVDY
jgi:hypothetical protein